MSRFKIIAVALSILFIRVGQSLCCKELLTYYRGNVKLPEELYRTYEALIAAFSSGKQSEIEKFCIPGEIRFTTARRQNPEYGQDINLPFLKNGFNRFILNLREDSPTEYLIRTGTTALWFRKTADGTWKLFRYLDKPME